MTLLFADSFDHYATADILQKWTSASSVGTNTTISAGNGRRGTACMRFSGGTGNGATKSGFTAMATMIVGFAAKYSLLPPSGRSAICILLDGSTTHVTVAVNSSGQIEVYRGTTGGTLLSTSTNVISAGATNFIEVKATINDSTGAVEVRVNGSSSGWISLTGVDTRNAGNSTVNSVQLSPANVAANNDIDDVYVCDTAGSTNNDFLGDVRVDCLFPNGNGNSSQLTGSDGNSTDNYQLVDESAANGDTDYVQSATVAQKDTYTMQDMSHTPTNIFGTQTVVQARKDDAGTRSIATVVRSGGSDTDGATQALSTSYAMYRQIRETDPNTSAAWTKTGFNSAEFGVKVAA